VIHPCGPAAGRGRSGVMLGIFVLALCASASACVYDSDEVCDHDRDLKSGQCVCKKGTVDKDGRCVKSEAKPAAMPANDAGGSDGGPAGIGASCSHDDPCQGELGFCLIAQDQDEGYCTKQGCSADADCGDAFYCSNESPRNCRRFPTGQGDPCTTQDDCKGYDASYCTIGNPFGVACAVPYCTEGSCPPDLTCFDASMFSPGTPKLCTELQQ
jgi:hypothetical protein